MQMVTDDYTDGACRSTLDLRRPVLLYAGTCRFCRWAARMVTRIDFDRRLAVLPLTADEVRCLLAGVSPRQRGETWWLVPCDGGPVSGRRGGGLALLMELRATRAAGRLLHVLRASPLVDALDAWLARWRSRFSRYVPDGPAPRRFP